MSEPSGEIFAEFMLCIRARSTGVMDRWPSAATVVPSPVPRMQSKRTGWWRANVIPAGLLRWSADSVAYADGGVAQDSPKVFTRFRREEIAVRCLCVFASLRLPLGVRINS